MINRVARPAMGRNAFSSSSATPTVLIPWAWIVAKKPCGARRPRKANGTLHGTGSFHHTATLVKLLSNLIARWVLDPKVRRARRSARGPVTCIGLTDPINCNLRKHA